MTSVTTAFESDQFHHDKNNEQHIFEFYVDVVHTPLIIYKTTKKKKVPFDLYVCVYVRVRLSHDLLNRFWCGFHKSIKICYT